MGETDMSSGVKSLAGIFGMTDFMIPIVLDDLTDEQACARARGEGGPSILWSVGHLLHYRCFMLGRFGQAHGASERLESLFASTAASDGSDYPSLNGMRDLWDEISIDFMSALMELTEDRLETRLQEGWRPDQTLRDQLVFFAWHEGYHLGAIGQIRKDLGLAGPAERVMALREASSGGEG
jgi:uncharacterized damage-inducible protein DinB